MYCASEPLSVKSPGYKIAELVGSKTEISSKASIKFFLDWLSWSVPSICTSASTWKLINGVCVIWKRSNALVSFLINLRIVSALAFTLSSLTSFKTFSNSAILVSS